MLVEGQGRFRQPLLDNHALSLDPYRAARSFDMTCVYDYPISGIIYTWIKNGDTIQRRRDYGVLTVPVPDGDYDSSLEGTYRCSVSFAGVTMDSRNFIVTLPGKSNM